MRTVEIKVYKFNELSDQAKKEAINKQVEQVDTSYIYDDARNTVEAFCKAFNVSTYDSFLEPRTSHVDDNILELSGNKLRKHLYNYHFSDLYKGKYYGRLTDTFKDGTKIEVSKEHPIGKRHLKRYSKVFFERECVFTGMCYDDIMLEPIYIFLDEGHTKDNYNRITFKDLIEECFEALKDALKEEEEYLTGEEYAEEEIEQNNYEFTEDGQRY